MSITPGRTLQRFSLFPTSPLHLIIFISYFLACLCHQYCDALPTPSPNIFNGAHDIVSNTTGAVEVFDPVTNQPIPQGAATDGAGVGWDLPAVLWVVMALITGVPLAVAGVRGGKFTSGVGVGLGLAVALWASIVNTVNANGVPDIATLLLVLLLFAIGCLVGYTTSNYGVGSTSLGAVGGLAIGVRIVLLRDGLLVPVFFVNWVIAGLFGLLGVALLLWKMRVGVIVGSASAGSFLAVLGLDLLLNKQAGISRGLRFLFDRNSNHLADILGHGGTFPISTKIFLGVSLATIPLFAFAQHKLFPRPFGGSERAVSALLDNGSDSEDRYTWFRRRKRSHSSTEASRQIQISAPIILSYPAMQSSRFSL